MRPHRLRSSALGSFLRRHSFVCEGGDVYRRRSSLDRRISMVVRGDDLREVRVLVEMDGSAPPVGTLRPVSLTGSEPSVLGELALRMREAASRVESLVESRDFNDRWADMKNDFGRLEAEQEARAFEAGMERDYQEMLGG